MLFAFPFRTFFAGILITLTAILNAPADDVSSFIHGIRDVSVATSGRQIIINVHLHRGVKCDYVLEHLRIKKMTIRGKSYYPTCKQINKNLIQITYSEGVNV